MYITQVSQMNVKGEPQASEAWSHTLFLPAQQALRVSLSYVSELEFSLNTQDPVYNHTQKNHNLLRISWEQKIEHFDRNEESVFKRELRFISP